MRDYKEFLASKTNRVDNSGIAVDLGDFNAKLFGFQKQLTQWALRKGRSLGECSGLSNLCGQVTGSRLLGTKMRIADIARHKRESKRCILADMEWKMKTCLSFGAGVQTTALLVLIVKGKWPRPDATVFSDTGDEHQETYDYLAKVSGPYARANGLKIEILGTAWRAPQYRQSLEEYCLKHAMLPGTWVRWCTVNYKIKPIERFVKRQLGATASNPVEQWIGISMDESRRAVPSSVDFQVKRYPLIELGLNREQCKQIIVSAGLPVPPKSGCWYCPFQRQGRWHQLKREQPALFARALALEHNAKGRDGSSKYLPMFGSLERIANQEPLPGFDEAIEAEGECATGVCFV